MIEAKSGQQKAEDNLLILEAWMGSKTDDDFKRYVYRGQLSRTEIATECKFAKSVLRNVSMTLRHLPFEFSVALFSSSPAWVD
jgi:hypothetical protein